MPRRRRWRAWRRRHAGGDGARVCRCLLLLLLAPPPSAPAAAHARGPGARWAKRWGCPGKCEWSGSRRTDPACALQSATRPRCGGLACQWTRWLCRQRACCSRCRTCGAAPASCEVRMHSARARLLAVAVAVLIKLAAEAREEYEALQAELAAAAVVTAATYLPVLQVGRAALAACLPPPSPQPPTPATALERAAGGVGRAAGADHRGQQRVDAVRAARGAGGGRPGAGGLPAPHGRGRHMPLRPSQPAAPTCCARRLATPAPPSSPTQSP